MSSAVRATASCLDAAGATSFPLPARGVGTLDCVLQFCAVPATVYSARLHHFLTALPGGHGNMVDRWLIAVRDQAQDVVRGCEDHQERDQGDSDSQPDFLRPLAQWASSEALEGVKREVAAIEQRHRQQIHQTDRN